MRIGKRLGKGHQASIGTLRIADRNRVGNGAGAGRRLRRHPAVWRALLAGLALGAGLLSPTAVQAQTLLSSNAGESTDDRAGANLAAQAFTVVAGAGDYRLSRITLDGAFSAGRGNAATLHGGSGTGPKAADSRTTEIAAWAQQHLSAGARVGSDGLACFSGATAAGHCHVKVVVGSGKASVEHPELRWVNTILGNIKSALRATYHAIRPKPDARSIRARSIDTPPPLGPA